MSRPTPISVSASRASGGISAPPEDDESLPIIPGHVHPRFAVGSEAPSRPFGDSVPDSSLWAYAKYTPQTAPHNGPSIPPNVHSADRSYAEIIDTITRNANYNSWVRRSNAGIKHRQGWGLEKRYWTLVYEAPVKIDTGEVCRLWPRTHIEMRKLFLEGT